MKLLFFGSPDFAVPSLRLLHGAGHRILRAVTRPDRPRGRSGRPVPTPVKHAARELGLPTFEPECANAPESVELLRGEEADLGIVVAFGEILSPALLSVTAGGFLNVHASLLPDYPGAAPVNWALINGETVTGVTVIRMTPQLDAGPILGSREAAIGEDETAGELLARLSVLGAELVTELVNRLDAGERIEGHPQLPRRSRFARKLTKEDGRIDWALPARDIVNRVRGLSPWPGAYCALGGEGKAHRVAVVRARVDEAEAAGKPGTVLRADEEGVLVRAGRGSVRMEEVKPAGSRAMSAAEFARGYRIEPGARFA